MAIKYVCDKCGAEVPDGNLYRITSYRNNVGTVVVDTSRNDLCLACKDAIIAEANAVITE